MDQAKVPGKGVGVAMVIGCYGNVSMEDPMHDHEPRSLGGLARHYLGDLVYGANDGIITTFAVVAGVSGASLSARTVLILGAGRVPVPRDSRKSVSYYRSPVAHDAVRGWSVAIPGHPSGMVEEWNGDVAARSGGVGARLCRWDVRSRADVAGPTQRRTAPQPSGLGSRVEWITLL